MKKLYFIRHGESQAQVDGSWATKDNQLSETGRQQVRDAAKKALRDELNFDVIISSPYLRARETAEIITKGIGYPTKDIVIDDAIKERFYGLLEGGLDAEGFFKNHVYKDIDNIEGAETVEALQKRASLVLKNLKTRPEEIILLVSHAAFGRALRRVINNQPYTLEYDGDREFKQIPNAELVCWIEE